MSLFQLINLFQDPAIPSWRAWWLSNISFSFHSWFVLELNFKVINSTHPVWSAQFFASKKFAFIDCYQYVSGWMVLVTLLQLAWNHRKTCCVQLQVTFFCFLWEPLNTENAISLHLLVLAFETHINRLIIKQMPIIKKYMELIKQKHFYFYMTFTLLGKQKMRQISKAQNKN